MPDRGIETMPIQNWKDGLVALRKVLKMVLSPSTFTATMRSAAIRAHTAPVSSVFLLPTAKLQIFA